MTEAHIRVKVEVDGVTDPYLMEQTINFCEYKQANPDHEFFREMGATYTVNFWNKVRPVKFA